MARQVHRRGGMLPVRIEPGVRPATPAAREVRVVDVHAGIEVRDDDALARVAERPQGRGIDRRDVGLGGVRRGRGDPARCGCHIDGGGHDRNLVRRDALDVGPGGEVRDDCGRRGNGEPVERPEGRVARSAPIHLAHPQPCEQLPLRRHGGPLQRADERRMAGRPAVAPDGTEVGPRLHGDDDRRHACRRGPGSGHGLDDRGRPTIPGGRLRARRRHRDGGGDQGGHQDESDGLPHGRAPCQLWSVSSGPRPARDGSPRSRPTRPCPPGWRRRSSGRGRSRTRRRGRSSCVPSRGWS